MTDIPALIERVRHWTNVPDCPLPSEVKAVMVECAEALSRLTASPLPGEIARFVAMIQSDSMDLRHKHVREEIAAALQRMAQEVERLTEPSNPPLTMNDALALLAAQGREIKRLLEKDQLRDQYVAQLDAAAKAPPPAEIAGPNSGWKCAANPYAVVPSDCNWPQCGCDPNVDRVIMGLQEYGYIITEPNDFPNVPEEIAELIESLHKHEVSPHHGGCGDCYAGVMEDAAAALQRLAQEVERLKTFHPIKEG